MKIQKLKLAWNTGPDNQRAFNFMRNPKLAHTLVSAVSSSHIVSTYPQQSSIAPVLSMSLRAILAFLTINNNI